MATKKKAPMVLRVFDVNAEATVGKFIGKFTAENAKEAVMQASESDATQRLGGLCHYCSRQCGDMGDWELTATPESDK